MERIDDLRPILSRHTEIMHNGEITIRFNRRSLILSENDRLLLLKIYKYLNGKNTINSIAENFQVNFNDLYDLIMELCNSGALFLPPSIRPMSGEDFAREFKDTCKLWHEEIYSGQLWSSLAEGSAKKEVLLGLLIEFYHYVESVKEHMSLAIANCRDYDLMLLLGNHFSEERDHGRIFLDACEAAGLPRDLVSSSSPLPSTRGIINFLREIAIKDTLTYCTTQALFQSTLDQEGQDKVNLFFSHLENVYNLPCTVSESFAKHTLLDIKLGHEELFLRVFAPIKRLESYQIRTFWNNAWVLVEILNSFFDGIYLYYSADHAEVPRQQIDILHE